MHRKKFLTGLLGAAGVSALAADAQAADSTPNVVSVTGAYTALPTDDVIFVSNQTGHAVVTLPAAAGAAGKRYTVAKTNPYQNIYLCNVVVAGGGTISGHKVRTLAWTGEALTVVSDGAAWQIAGGDQEQFHTPKEWFVSGPVFEGMDGRTARTAFQTFAQAMAAANGGDTIWVCDDYADYQGGVVIDKPVRVVGLGNRPIVEIADSGGGFTADSFAVKVTAQGAQLVNLRIQAPPNWPGTCLLIDGGSGGSFRQLTVGPAPGGTPTAYPTSAAHGTGQGGIGVVASNCEGCYIEDIHIGGCSIGLGIGNEASTNKINRMTISSCYQDIVGGLKTSEPVPNAGVLLPAPWTTGGNGGGWTISHFKDTNPASRPVEGWSQLPVIQLNGSGDHVFEAMDASEGGFQLLDIDADRNTFIRCVSAPATVFRVKGSRNHFVNTRILGAGMIVDGDYNVFDHANSNGVFTGAGSHNRFQGVTFSQGPDLALAMTGGDNTFDGDCVFGGVAGGQTPSGLPVLGTRPKFVRAESVVPLTYGPTVTVDLRQGTHYTLAIGNGSPWTLANPVDSGNANPANLMLVKEITLEIRGRSSGTAGSVTLGSLWKLVGGKLTAPAAGTRMILKATFNGTHMVETGRITGIAL